MVQARSHYDRAIMGLKGALKNPNVGRDDSVVAALFILGLFEAIGAQPQSRLVDTEATCHPHSRGALALLQHRSSIKQDSNLDRVVLRFFSHVALMEYFMSPPGFAPLWTTLSIFEKDWAKGPILEPLMSRAVEYKASAERLISHPSSKLGPTVGEMLKPGLDILHDLADAARIESLCLPDVSTKMAFNDLMDTELNANALIASCLYLTVRLQLIELTLSMIITAEEQSEDGDELHNLTDQGSKNVKLICQKISAIFRDGQPGVGQHQGWPFRAWCMLWPMAAIMNSCLAEEETRGWIKSKLCHVGKLTGFGLMTIIAST
ncbi:hypothetical protein BDP55DRAFT_667986 [Colletotrichum godetiae]|uniref:C6 zinc finger domain-containing protein n=1 Tax=Colletotrichum godetiae TaxID=1209918 RepID=A0AAJ0EWD5_9PEZI|nr:uncharacterized protein BDP55DRAFT_667986 [Colletotrichum godetiae]KAK1674125.1 hypothetical protein BDP55DRAFT_667986 [Colletotrichum godetiae]